MSSQLYQYGLWLQGSGAELVFITLWRLTYFLLFVVVEVVTFLMAIATAIVDIITNLYELVLIFIIGFFAFFWWYVVTRPSTPHTRSRFYYPDLQPWLSTFGVDLVNLGLQLFQLAWDLFIILWNLFVMVWNGT